jgi:hypothetical protein
MRVRIRRFGWLRLAGKSRHPHSVVVAGIETELHERGRATPPAARVRRRSRRGAFFYAEFAQFGIDLGAAFPLLELQRSQAVTDPFVVLGEDAGRIRQSEVFLPPRQILPQLRDYGIRFLFVGSRFCSALPPDIISR